MGLTTKDERRSAISLLLYSINPIPSGSIGTLDRKQVSGVYADFITNPTQLDSSDKRRAGAGILLYSVAPIPTGSTSAPERMQAAGLYPELTIAAPTQLVSTQAGASADYLPYLLSNPVKTAQLNKPTLLNFSLAPWNSSFVKLNRGAYIKLNTQTYGAWFTGYITNDPELQYLGTLAGQPVWGYQYQATSDEYYLNLRPLGIMPPFTNTTQGAVLRSLAEKLAPGMFDTGGITDGQVVARYVVDPQTRFSDVVSSFSQGWYTFWARDKKLYFASQDSLASPLTIDGNSRYFTPVNLSLAPTTDPIYNDAIVLGMVEPQNYCNEYFVGDGFTGSFPLLWAAFGTDTTVYLTDTFQSSQLDNTKWTLYDQPANYIQVSNGYVNCIGGPQDNSYDTYLTSENLIPLEGVLRLTHGSWDIVSASDGVICSLWNGAPSSSLSGCFYGIKCTPSGANTLLNPIINGVVDNTQSLTISAYTNRFIFRTLCTFNLAHRVDNSYTYSTPSGSVGSYGGGGKADTVSYSTWIVEIDPNTGFILNETQWSNNGVRLNADQFYAYYTPCVLNNLNLAFTDITVSVPQMASMQIMKQGTNTWVSELVGPNELDSLDGQAPYAAITDANNGTSTKSSLLGSPQYNPGQASLQFFKNTALLESDVPGVGDIIHLSYRFAASSVGRARKNAVVSTEAAAWGDDGIRTIVSMNPKPAPRNSTECDMAAAAMVSDNSYQHYNGQYTQWSMYEFTTEPVPGTFVQFADLPQPTFPATIPAMPIQQVQSTFAALAGGEKFQHVVTFGPADSLDQMLNKFITQSDVFLNDDSVEIPIAIDPSAVGLNYAPDVPGASLASWDLNDLYFNTNQASPTGGSFEVRYSDAGWGADDGMNLVIRTTGQTFKVPRNFQAGQLYIRAQDGRNKLLYSEDYTKAAWVMVNGATVSRATGYDPDGNQSQICTVSMGSTGSGISQSTSVAVSGAQLEFSVSMLGSNGQQATILIDNSAGGTLASKTVTLNGFWQRFTVSATVAVGTGGNAVCAVTNPGSSQSVKITRASLEVGTATETVYCKTNATTYGAVSRYPASFHVSFPLQPPAPTGTIDMTDPSNPILTIELPSNMQYVWGYEIRASDNKTVLQHQDLVNIGVTSTVTYQAKNNTSASPSFWIYTYNIFQEYSPGDQVTFEYPMPVVSNVSVDEIHRMIVWTSTDADEYIVEIDPVDDTFQHDEINLRTPNEYYTIGSNAEFYGLRYIRITPLYTPLRLTGTGAVVSHQYTPDAVMEFDGNEVANVPTPTSPTADPTLPASVQPFSSTVLAQVWANYQINEGRY